MTIIDADWHSVQLRSPIDLELCEAAISDIGDNGIM